MEEVVRVPVEDECSGVRPLRHSREGWAEAARAMAARGDDPLLDPEAPTSFDVAEWEW